MPRYSPGQSARASGAYCVHHGTGYREDHDLLAIRGEGFAACRSCKGDVQFTLTKQAIYITDDFDFAAPIELILVPKKPAARAHLAEAQTHRAPRESGQPSTGESESLRQCNAVPCVPTS